MYVVGFLIIYLDFFYQADKLGHNTLEGGDMLNIRKSTLILALIVLMTVPTLAQSGNGKVRIIVESANVRLEPNPDSKIMTSVPMGAILTVSFQKGEWFMVELPKNAQGITVTGYLHQSSVEVISPVAPAQQAAPVQPPAQTRTQPRAQTPPPPPPVQMGRKTGGFKIMGGLSLANVSFKDTSEVTDKPGYRMGIIGGAGYEMALGNALIFEVDVLYQQRGFKYDQMRDTSVTVGADTYTYGDKIVLKSDVVAIPALVKFKFNPGGGPFVLAGFEGAFVLSSKVDYTGTTYKNGSVDSEEKSSEDVKEFTKSTDYGLVFGGGYEFNVGSTALVIDARYQLGLANMLDPGDSEASPDDWIKSKGIVVMLGMKF